MAILGALARGAGSGLKAAGKVAGGAALLGTGNVVRQAASALPGGEMIATTAMGGMAAGLSAMGKSSGAGGGAGGATSGGAAGGGAGELVKKAADLTTGIKQLISINAAGWQDVSAIRGYIEDMKSLAFEKARQSLKEMPKPQLAATPGGGKGADTGAKPDTGSWIAKALLGASLFASFVSGFFGGLRASVITAFAPVVRFFGPQGAIATRLIALRTLILESKALASIRTFFGPQGAIATRFVALKTAITEMKIFSSIKTFFGPQGAIATKLTALKTAITDMKIFSSIRTFFSPAGIIGTQITALKTAVTDSKVLGSIKTFFGPNGAIATKITSIKNALTAIKMPAFGSIFGANGVIASRLASITASLRGVGSAVSAGATGAMGKAAGAAKGIGGGVISAFNTAKGLLSGFFGSAKAGTGVVGIFGKLGSIATIAKDMVAGPLKAIGPVVKSIGATLGRVFLPITWIIGLFEGITGFISGFKEEGETEDADIFTKIWSGLITGLQDAFNALVTMPIDLIIDGAAWLMKKFGFDETAQAFKDFSLQDQIVDPILNWVKEMPIKAWNWLKGMLGIGKGESEEGQAGGEFMANFKKKLAGLGASIANLIPDFGDIGNIAMSVFARIQKWFGQKIIGLGNSIKDSWFPGSDRIGEYFVGMGQDMIKGGESTEASVAQARADKAAQIEKDTSTAAAQTGQANEGAGQMNQTGETNIVDARNQSTTTVQTENKSGNDMMAWANQFAGQQTHKADQNLYSN